MRRIYLEKAEVAGGRISVTGSTYHYLGHVLRLKPGDSFIGFDGSGQEYTVRVTSIRNRTLQGLIVSQTAGQETESPVEIILYQSIPKADKMERIIRAVSQLGVRKIVPVLSIRSVPRPGENDWKTRCLRWQKLAQEGAKVAHRTIVPQVLPCLKFSEALKLPGDFSVIFWEGEKGSVRKLAGRLPRPAPAGGKEPGSFSLKVFIGPEGGYSEEEIASAQSCGVVPASLGKRILQVETAPVVALTLLLYELDCL